MIILENGDINSYTIIKKRRIFTQIYTNFLYGERRTVSNLSVFPISFTLEQFSMANIFSE